MNSTVLYDLQCGCVESLIPAAFGPPTIAIISHSIDSGWCELCDRDELCPHIALTMDTMLGLA